MKKITNYNIFYTIFIFLVLLLITSIFNFKENFQIKNDLHLITPDVNNIFLFWEGSIKNIRLELLKMAIKSTYYYNPNKKIYLFSNSLKNDKRIKFFGLLTSKQLQNAYKKADIFLNPRPVEMFVNDISFPSKLFDYLSWNKPIISTCTKSLDPIYKKILHIVEDNPASIALAMRSYLEGKKYYKIKNKKWILNKNWNNEANKLKNFLKKVIIKKNFT